MAAVTGAVVGGLTLANSVYQGNKATKASEKASDVAAQGQQNTLEYLQAQEDKYSPYRIQGLEGLSEFSKVPGQPLSQEELIAQAKGSPLYAAIMSGQDASEESILRNASATGKLRSGNTIDALSENAMNLNTTALLAGFDDARNRDDYTRAQHLEGLRALSGTPSMAGNVATQMNNLSGTQAQGILGAAQTAQNSNQNTMNNLMGLTGLGIQAYQAGAFKSSDIRLKRNIRLVGEKNGYNIYSWYWNSAASVLGLAGKSVGCLAHEVYEKDFTAVGIRDGFLTINYDQLGLGELHG